MPQLMLMLSLVYSVTKSLDGLEDLTGFFSVVPPVDQAHEMLLALRGLDRVLVGAVDPQHRLYHLQVEGIRDPVRQSVVVAATGDRLADGLRHLEGLLSKF